MQDLKIKRQLKKSENKLEKVGVCLKCSVIKGANGKWIFKQPIGSKTTF